ncbi:MAG: nitrate reductase molybdenum cofactor assembly chaperone, partial [Sinobacterium sp.]|nr:nitrate reductase molybdenum cofactor assembly chaperone [Sinobacterium sp.]
ELSPAAQAHINALIDDIYQGDLMDSQERYLGLFDRGRHLSLLLFEHVHGESRDRGQAMVDLMDVYEKKGLNISVRELPDYIPLYLEYLAHCTHDEIVEGLADVSHILAMLSARLFQRDSLYHSLFDCLIELAHVDVNVQDLREQASKEERDDSFEALDKIWEEEAVRFDGSDVDSCTKTRSDMGIDPNEPTPIRFVDSAKSAAASQQ